MAKTEKQAQWWFKRAQESYSGTENFKQDQLRLDLQKNGLGLYECRGRIQGSYSIYLPPDDLLSEKLTQDAHDVMTSHGGVGLTMAFSGARFGYPG